MILSIFSKIPGTKYQAPNSKLQAPKNKHQVPKKKSCSWITYWTRIIIMEQDFTFGTWDLVLGIWDLESVP
jgi:hypothetical protein